VEWLKSLVTGFLLFLVIRVTLVQTFTIISGSMENTLLVGDFLVISKAAYGATIPGTDFRLPGYSEPQRGDVIVSRSPVESLDVVKRLVGLPGDTLSMREGVLRINGAEQTEPYVRRESSIPDGTDPEMLWQIHFLADPDVVRGYRPTRDNWGPIVVPEASYFVLGDNRDVSRDSRYWGFIPYVNLKGRVLFLYFSWAREAAGGRPYAVPDVRWSRIGDRIR
jgi:signal peptidase I